jgi:uncharacterized protein (UPF0276 family)
VTNVPFIDRAARVAPIPAIAGIGLRTPHQEQIALERPAVGWLEVHSENFFAEGGMQVERLMSARSLYPLSLHGVGMSLGSTDPLDTEHVRKLKRLVGWSEPAFVSEHMSWGSIDGTHLNDLLPLPLTEEALELMIARVGQLQDLLGRQILVENVSSYLQFAHSQIAEWDFLAALGSHAGCGLLVDVNNIYVSACNHGFDARHYLSALPRHLVQELHLAGHSRNRCGDREILIDTHSAPICDEVWELYEFALGCFGRVPTLIEWDADLPSLEVLMEEAGKANHRLDKVHALAA